MEFVAHLYNDPSFVGKNYMVGAAFEISPNEIWAGQMQVTATTEMDPSGMVCFACNLYQPPTTNMILTYRFLRLTPF